MTNCGKHNKLYDNDISPNSCKDCETMEFEEEFPSLKGLAGFEITNRPDGIKKQVRNYSELDIQEHCLDKQRARKVIGPITFMRGITQECRIHNAVNRERERIKKELEL